MEEIPFIIMLNVINHLGVSTILQRESESAVRSLYIPQIDTTLYGTSSGQSCSGFPHIRFTVYLREEESVLLRDIIRDFTDSGWSAVYPYS